MQETELMGALVATHKMEMAAKHQNLQKDRDDVLFTSLQMRLNQEEENHKRNYQQQSDHQAALLMQESMKKQQDEEDQRRKQQNANDQRRDREMQEQQLNTKGMELMSRVPSIEWQEAIDLLKKNNMNVSQAEQAVKEK